MSWSIEEHIGDCRPFPAQVVVYRGETNECMAYVSGEVVDRLKAENGRLRELVRGLNWCTESPDGPRVDCERCPLGVVDGEPLELMCEKMMRKLGIEVGE